MATTFKAGIKLIYIPPVIFSNPNSKRIRESGYMNVNLFTRENNTLL